MLQKYFVHFLWLVLHVGRRKGFKEALEFEKFSLGLKLWKVKNSKELL